MDLRTLSLLWLLKAKQMICLCKTGNGDFWLNVPARFLAEDELSLTQSQTSELEYVLHVEDMIDTNIQGTGTWVALVRYSLTLKRRRCWREGSWIFAEYMLPVDMDLFCDLPKTKLGYFFYQPNRDGTAMISARSLNTVIAKTTDDWEILNCADWFVTTVHAVTASSIYTVWGFLIGAPVTHW